MDLGNISLPTYTIATQKCCSQILTFDDICEVLSNKPHLVQIGIGEIQKHRHIIDLNIDWLFSPKGWPIYASGFNPSMTTESPKQIFQYDGSKKEINFTKDSILTLMQEIYNELVEQRSTAIRIQNKMISMMQQPEDMTLIGPVIEKQQKIINDCVEKKLTLSKLQSGIWEKQNSKEDSFDITEMDEDVLQNLIQKDINSDGEKFSL
jgi:hypothetical protein